MKLKYLVDTNICIYIAKKKPATVLKKFEEHEVGEIAMSVITYGELLYGAKKSHSPAQAQNVLLELATIIPAIELTENVSWHYGDIRAHLEKKGSPIGNNDLWIASHARAMKLVLVTNNTREFNRVPDLHVENWVTD